MEIQDLGQDMGEQKQKIGVIGLGSMGFGVAQSALRAGHTVYGFDINPKQVEAFQAVGGAKGSMAEVAGDLDAVVTIVLNAAQTESVLFGSDGIAGKLRKGAAILSSATVAPDFAREMEKRCAELGVYYLDAPVSGGTVRAASGELSVMSSGSEAAYTALAPTLDAIASNVFKLGDSAGAGSAMKAVNQLLVGVHIAACAEAMTFGISQGIDPELMIDVISKSAGTSWALEHRGPKMATADYSPSSMINIWPKDLGIVQDISRGAQFATPIASAALQVYLTAQGMGLGFEDDTAITKVYEAQSNITLPQPKTKSSSS
ncbi:L-threonate dehydrogenase [Pacificibacter marinus]|uniref:L-threonate dehydrogenase n=1 Tax=Pacificibacter marinus TaxID=658057 RepID=A0A1Y5TUC0_9RHOB|nr:L-threonate dehydrogenase [Pacificibacter marinus]SEL33814.1 3-hydroxyisobutyrate dehydrogenase [Pacificibacter marinus]SLN68374.1 2-(hydroxymethyl)glutarate dehydrogenase [Pacificibacter marinus]